MAGECGLSLPWTYAADGCGLVFQLRVGIFGCGVVLPWEQ